jgi:hypothetical protein
MVSSTYKSSSRPSNSQSKTKELKDISEVQAT